MAAPRKEKKVNTSAEPMMVAIATDVTTTRRNRGSTIERTDKYANIQAGTLPYSSASSFGSNELNIKEVIILCQKAYANSPVIRNIIDLMTEFSVGDIYFSGGNKASRNFFEALYKKINLWRFQDEFYREYYRSGNIFTIRFDSLVSPADVKKITQVFGQDNFNGGEKEPKIPARYMVLNPADILFSGNISFASGIYSKRLSDYELTRLRNPQTDEDREVLESLPPKVRELIKNKTASVVNIPLNNEMVTAIFYKKQSYEPFAVPMVYPVLEDVNYKMELKKLDAAIARTQQQVILLVTQGAKPEEGGVNQEHIKALQKLFQNESIGRVLIADYTTNAKFVIPEIGNILTASKYEQLDRDINLGLNNILVGGEKFANQSSKVDVFLARLNHGRNVFLTEFLIPEIRRIAKNVGFKNFPTPYYDDIALKNNDLRDRIYVRLAELGLLTPGETFTALDSGRLPDDEQSLENQNAYKQLKDGGLFQPVLNKQQQAGGGRPAANSKGVPQQTKKVSPIGASEKYSVSKFVVHAQHAGEVKKKVENVLKAKFKKRKLNDDQSVVASHIAKIIICNEEPENWEKAVRQYCDKPLDTNPERIKEILTIAAEHGLDDYLSGLIYWSKI